MSTRPERAMVLAAGLGRRMRAANSTRPKPLVPLAGAPLIVYAFARLREAGIGEIVVNTHYLAEQIDAFLADYAKAPEAPSVKISHEPILLETGGGVFKALDLLGAAPFYVMNSDVVILDDGDPALRRLSAAWDEQRMDGLLLLCPADNVRGYDGTGDFFLSEDGRLERRGSKPRAPFVFTGVQLLHPRLFADSPGGAYSLNRHYDEALTAGRLFGLAHRGIMLHVGSPEGLAAGEAHLAEVRARNDHTR
jgi:MurNAc alpha-1-phosphate uridylyltransferase